MQIPQENSIRINRPIVIGNPLSSFLPLFCWRPVIHIVTHFIPVSITNVINIRHQFHNLTRMPVYNDALTRNFLPPFCHSQLVSVILFLVVLFPGTIAVPRLEKMPDTNKKRGRKLRRRKRDRRGGEKKVGDPLMDDLGNYLRTFPCYLLFSLRKCTKQHTLRDPFCPLFPLASSSCDSFFYRLFLPVIFVSHGRGQDG